MANYSKKPRWIDQNLECCPLCGSDTPKSTNVSLGGCPECYAEYFRRYYDEKGNRQKRRNPLGIKAHSIIRNEIRSGRMVIGNSCENIIGVNVCGSNRNLVFHHYKGYEYPLAVITICHRCNILLG